MRTFGSRERIGRPMAYAARCEICGVVWPRYALREDGKGNLVCPDEGPGLDDFTLAEQSAEDLTRFFDRERPDERRGLPPPQSDFSTSPISIDESTVGWWAPDNGLRVTPTEVRWRNSASPVGPGDLYGSGTVPTAASSGLVFAGGAPLLSSFGKMAKAGDVPVVWMVATLTEEVDTYQEMLALTTGGDSSGALAGCGIGRYRSDTNSGKVYGWAKFAAADAGVQVLAPRPADGQHIYRLTATSTLLTLEVDDDAYTAVPSYVGDGFDAPLGSVVMGYQGHGTYNEGVVHL